MMNRRYVVSLVMAGICAAMSAEVAVAQQAYVERGSANMEVLAHVPLGALLTTSDLDIEQELSRPYVYIARRYDEAGFDIIDVGDPANPRVIYRWRIENVELHQGTGGTDPKHFKLNSRYYLVAPLQFDKSGPDYDLGAVVFDVTGLPDVRKVKEVGRIHEPEGRGFHNIFIYKHSDGRMLLLTTVAAEHANVFDMGVFLRDGDEAARVATIPIPESLELEGRRRREAAGGRMVRAYHDMYAAYDPATGQDKFYGGGYGGYYVYDISNLNEPTLLTSITGVAGVSWGHTFTPTPDGRYAVGETEYQYAPLRIYDLKPGLDGEVGHDQPFDRSVDRQLEEPLTQP